MLLTNPRKVASGFFRNHLYVVLGLMVLAALVGWGMKPASTASPWALQRWIPVELVANQWVASRWLAVAAAVISYIGAASWLYEKISFGRAMLVLLAIVTAFGSLTSSRLELNSNAESTASLARSALWVAEPLMSSWLLGGVFTSMLLGHWYLNAPGMNVSFLQKLMKFASAGAVLRLVLWCISFALEWQHHGAMPRDWMFWTLHGGVGLAVTLPILWMTWETLKIPNTQSATGILYVGVILTFLGEVSGMLVSKSSYFPL